MPLKFSGLPLVLASGSPRRRQLLRQAGFHFLVSKSRYLEGLPGRDPHAFVRRTALGKAAEVAQRCRREAWILGADTVVVQGGKIFGKPGTVQEASRMLRALAGRSHKVVTGVALVRAFTGEKYQWEEETAVWMRSLEAGELQAYLRGGEWKDKAGAYGIQGRAGAWVTKICGCYYNVVGLPLGLVSGELIRRGIGGR